MALDRELAAFRSMLPALLPEHTGEWAVVKGDQLLGIQEFYEDALEVGYERCELPPFLVKQILATEPVLHFTHDLPLPGHATISYPTEPDAAYRVVAGGPRGPYTLIVDRLDDDKVTAVVGAVLRALGR